MSRVSLSITIVFFYEHFVNKVRKKETELFFSVSFLLLAIRFHLKYLNLFGSMIFSVVTQMEDNTKHLFL